MSWTNAVGVSVSNNNLTKTAPYAWGNGGAASTQTITSGDGYVETTVNEVHTARIFGFSRTDANQSWSSIEFGLHLEDSNNLIYVYESGVERGIFGTYAAGDILRVAIESGVVKYKKNGTVFYTSTVSPSYPLLGDTALYTNGATLTNVVISSTPGNSGANINWLVTDQLLLTDSYRRDRVRPVSLNTLRSRDAHRFRNRVCD